MDNNKQTFACPYANMQPCLSNADDEIDLLDIWNVLWRRRGMIALITVLVTAAATAYAFLAPKVYEIKVNITAPARLTSAPESSKIITDLLAVSATTGITEAMVFAEVVKNFQDKNIRDNFAAESKSPAKLIQNIRIEPPNKKKGNNSYQLSLSGNNPAAMVTLLDSFVNYVDTYSENKIIDDLKLALTEKKFAVEAQIESLRHIAAQNIQRQISGLLEQKKIAEKLKIIDPPANIAVAPLYARGSKALQLEIDMKRQRKNNDLYIAGLPALQEQLRAMDEIDLSRLTISTMQADEALVPVKPKKPKRQLIIALGLVLGLMLGVFAVFFGEFLNKARRQQDKKKEEMLR